MTSPASIQEFPPAAPSAANFEVNGRRYAPPAAPVVVICLDGCDNTYLEAAFHAGVMPILRAVCHTGHRCLAASALPSFTNVNNTSIVTGVPPSVHGICGNYFLEPGTGQEVMMNSNRFLRAPTILAAAARAGRKVGVVTAKEKLLAILNDQLTGIAFSAEFAGRATRATHGIDGVEKLVGRATPPIYSPEASLFVLRAGGALIAHGLADFVYLSTTDYMQHTFAPDAPESLRFHAEIDMELGRLLALGAVIGLTADHGMNAKHDERGKPNVLYLEEALLERFGPGVSVILPITDPYVAHHGALGSFAVVHLPAGLNPALVGDWLRLQPGVTEVYTRAQAARDLELPEDRVGDLVVLSGKNAVLGRRPGDHDLGALHGALRSHGGRFEQMVPFILSHPLHAKYRERVKHGGLRNFDIFEFACNGCDL